MSQAELQFEAGYTQPEFGLFRNEPLLLHHLFARLEPHGLRLNDVRLEHSSAKVVDQQIILNLFNYWMTVKIQIEKIEVTCTQLPRNYVEKMNLAILDILRAVTEYRPELTFKAFAVGVGLHAKPEGQTSREYLARFVANPPQNIGASTGNGVVFYLGPEGDRMWSSVTADVSVVVQDAMWLRILGTWDAKKVLPNLLPGIVESFVQQVLEKLDLQISA